MYWGNKEKVCYNHAFQNYGYGKRINSIAWSRVKCVHFLHFFSESSRRYLRVPRKRIWSCKPLDRLWGKKRYYFKEKDFCRNQWRKKLNPSSRPRCNKKIAPTIAFYHQNNEDVPICKIDMNDGNNDVFQQCLKIISSYKENGMIPFIIM